MKKSIPKLVLHRETVRTLVNTELARVVGGLEDNCPAVTRQESSCAPAIQADPLVLNPTTR
jgi:hypothetical protein